MASVANCSVSSTNIASELASAGRLFPCKRSSGENSDSDDRRRGRDGKKKRDSREIEQPMLEDEPPILIASYNYKGGVGKTTQTINLGYALRDRGYNTCYVDCDSQCNLSSFFNRHEAPANPPQQGGVQPSNSDGDDVQSMAGENIYPHRPSLSMARVGEPDKPEYSLELCKQGNFDSSGDPYELTLVSVLNEAFDGRVVSTNILEFSKKRGKQGERDYSAVYPPGLFLLPGHVDLHDLLEPRLWQAKNTLHHDDPDIRESALRTFGSFRKALLDIAKEKRIKFMVCDFGPSAGLANQVMVGSCDLIIPPFQPDYFSASAIDGILTRVLPKGGTKGAHIGFMICVFLIEIKKEGARLHGEWIQDPAALAVWEPDWAPRAEAFLPYMFNPRPPRLLPFLMVNFNVSGRQLGQYETNYLHLARRIVEKESITVVAMVANPARQDHQQVQCLQDIFLPDNAGSMVVPFARWAPLILGEAQARGDPAVSVTPDILTQWLERDPPPAMLSELEHLREAYRRLAQMVESVCCHS
eukprot:jgi/Mesvir1/1709/Mv21165-RA.1